MLRKLLKKWRTKKIRSPLFFIPVWQEARMSELKPDESFLSVSGLAEKLSCSRSFVYQACQCGVKINGRLIKLPHYRLGGRLRFSFPEVAAFLREGDE